MEMSQAHNSRDNQALLQSMLQRLKLQAGATNINSEQITTGGTNLQLTETLSLQTVNNNNGFEQIDNIKSEFNVHGKLQDPDISPENNGASGHSQEHGHGQHFFSNSAQPAAPIYSDGSFNLSKSETNDVSHGQRTEEKQNQDVGFVPKPYIWATQNTDTQKDNAAFGGKFGATGKNNNKKQRSSEDKTRKWTQKIKEKWRERPGSFGKKDRFADKTTQENSAQCPASTHLNLSSIEESVGTPTPEDRTEYPQIQAENGNEECRRSTNDFDLGLGTFSLLDEIVSGQEWGKFLNPATSALVDEMPPQETNYHDGKSRYSSMLNEGDVGTNVGAFGTSGDGKAETNTDIAMTPVSLEPPSHAHMDITDKTQTQAMPMDPEPSQSDMQVSDEQPQNQHTAERELSNTVDNSSLRGRNSLGRKRQHQSSASIVTKLPRVVMNGNVTLDDGSVFLPDNHVMDDDDGRLIPLVPSTNKPAPRGVLKSTLSCDSANSVETVSKKRRMEEARHVHFSEEIISIEPPEPGLYASESEEESEEEEDSFLEDSEEHAEPAPLGPVRPEEAAPAQRNALPAWIRALKRKNTGKKPR